jgi:hypothetical protein
MRQSDADDQTPCALGRCLLTTAAVRAAAIHVGPRCSRSTSMEMACQLCPGVDAFEPVGQLVSEE